MMQLNYTGPVKRAFGLQLKDGSRIMIQPGKAFTVDETNGQHVLRNWSGMFAEVKEAEPQAEKTIMAEKSTRATKSTAAEKPAEPAEETE